MGRGAKDGERYYWDNIRRVQCIKDDKTRVSKRFFTEIVYFSRLAKKTKAERENFLRRPRRISLSTGLCPSRHSRFPLFPVFRQPESINFSNFWSAAARVPPPPVQRQE